MAFVRFKPTVATVLATVVFSLPVAAQEDRAAELLLELRESGPVEAERTAEALRREWSKSGSATMDLLLKRGRDALEAGEWGAAAEHFTALTDHAPNFAEGYIGRAMAWFQLDRYGPAVADLEMALSLNPEQFDAIRGLGAIFEALDRPEMAFRAYREVLEINPHDEEVKEALERLDILVNGQSL